MRIGIAGHQAIPYRIRASVRGELERQIKNVPRPFSGISSLAEGADQMFAEIVLALGGSLVAVIPAESYESTFSTTEARRNYLGLLSQADSVMRLPFDEPSEAAFLEAGKYVVDSSDWIIAVWDGKPARGIGGTADIVAYARDLDKLRSVIWPLGVIR